MYLLYRLQILRSHLRSVNENMIKKRDSQNEECEVVRTADYIIFRL